VDPGLDESLKLSKLAPSLPIFGERLAKKCSDTQPRSASDPNPFYCYSVNCQGVFSGRDSYQLHDTTNLLSLAHDIFNRMVIDQV
jgi:hypothetical protein